MARGAELRGAGQVVSRVMVMITVGRRGGVGREGVSKAVGAGFRRVVRTRWLVGPKDARCSCWTAGKIDAN